MRARRWLLAAFVWLAPGCAMHLGGHGPEMLDEAIRDAAAEVNLHHALMGGADDMNEVRVEMSRHAAAMDDRLREMRRRVDDWSCEDHGGMDALEGLMEEVEAREAAYRVDMRGMGDVAGAREVCGRYGDEMDEMLGRMMNRWRMMDCEYGW